MRLILIAPLVVAACSASPADTEDLGGGCAGGCLDMTVATDAASQDLAPLTFPALDLATPNDVASAGEAPYRLAEELLIPSAGNALAAGDWDGDKHTDLAVSLGSAVLVLTNDGTGRFAMGQRTPVCRGQHGVALAAGEWDGDGKLDLYVGCTAQGANFQPLPSFLEYYRGHGDGTFAAPVETALTGSTDRASVTAADWNGDGRLDLMALASTGAQQTSIYVFLGRGDGTFQALARMPVAESNAQFGTNQILPVDYDADGKLDAVVGPGYGSIALLAGHGDGTFTAQSVRWSGGSFGILGISAADFDRDGLVDLALAVSTKVGAVGFSRNLGGNGFATQVDYYGPGVNYANATVVVDADHDGLWDVVECGEGGLLTFRGTGDGKFIAAGATHADTSDGPLVIADWNGDGVTDLASVSTTAVLFFVGR